MLKIVFSQTDKADIHVVLFSETNAAPSLDAFDSAILNRAFLSGKFTGKIGQHLYVQVQEDTKPKQAMLLGIGQSDMLTGLKYERIGAELYKALSHEGFNTASIVLESAHNATRLAAGAQLAAYRFDKYKTKLKPKDIPSLKSLIVSCAGAEREYGRMLAMVDGVYLARDLVTEPANGLHPEQFAKDITLLQDDDVDIEILDEKELTKLGMCALLAVGQGSQYESKVAIMKWNGDKTPDSKPIVLVGKGVTFDTGGISIKGASNMEAMKGDMAGAASVVGTMRTLARRRAVVNVVGIVGLVENMPGGKAFRPSDILKAADGQTIEVQNTDAEGRLVLADLLWLAQTRFAPKAIVNLATLTGAAVRALGNEYAALFSNDDELASQLHIAGERSGEQIWRLPMNDEYDRSLDSQFADMRNIGGAPGATIAAQFLKRFVHKNQAWAHLDMGGMAFRSENRRAANPAWATGFGPRLLDTWIYENFENKTQTNTKKLTSPPEV